MPLPPPPLLVPVTFPVPSQAAGLPSGVPVVPESDILTLFFATLLALAAAACL
jgi:hypothetical protein